MQKGIILLLILNYCTEEIDDVVGYCSVLFGRCILFKNNIFVVIVGGGIFIDYHLC